MKEICGNCFWFRPEPTTPIDPNAPIIKSREAGKTRAQRVVESGGRSPIVYGQCVAEYVDIGGKIQVTYGGMLSVSCCTAIDDNGLDLFQSK